MVRADNLAKLTEAGRAALVNYGVRSIVDLRMPDEVSQYPNPFAQSGQHGVAYTNVSFVDQSAASSPDFTTLANDYKRMLDRFSPAVAQIMTAIAEAPPGAVLIHCMGGKDRTGLISALLLELVGVPRETIGADYGLTAEYLRPLDDEFLANGPGERADREDAVTRYMPLAEVMLEVLDDLDERCGGVESYLLRAGVTQQNIERLRQRLCPAP
ncbi:MAG: tyrosine-protein phosphatase [Chloroflexota bacterium]